MSNGRKIKFGVRMHQGGYEYEAVRQVWKEADRLGYHSATLYDLLNVPALECWTTLAALAAETQRIRLVPLVLANLYRHPAVLAKMASTLDVISGGRLELGMGAGGGESDHEAYGLPFPPTPVRVAMLEEAVGLIKALWSGPGVSFQGKHYQIHEARCDPYPVQKPHPPFVIGGHGKTHLLRAVATHADIYNMRMDMSVGDHQDVRRLLEGLCRKVGRDPSEIEASQNSRVFIAEDSSSLETLLCDQAGKQGVAVDRFRASLGDAIVGTPAQCVDQVRRYVDVGVTYFFLLFPHPIDLGQLRLFAEEVMPAYSAT